MKTENTQMSESYLMGMLLAVIGGFLDAYTYILRGHVFANAQTGNMVLLAIKLSEGDFNSVGFYLLPITAFVGGVLIAEHIRKKAIKNHRLHWRQIVIFVELLIILLVSFIPAGPMDSIVNILISFVSSLQVQCFRKVKGNIYATTMCTGNLRSASEGLYRFIELKDISSLNRSITYLGIILFFIFGAIAGAVVVKVYGEASTLFCCLLLIAAFLLMFKHEGAVENRNI